MRLFLVILFFVFVSLSRWRLSILCCWLRFRSGLSIGLRFVGIGLLIWVLIWRICVSLMCWKMIVCIIWLV